jgi:septum formation protein
MTNLKTGTSVRLVLASASPRRSELISKLNIPFDIRESGVEEEEPSAISPWKAVQKIASQKALAVAHGLEEKVVLGADTVIDDDGILVGKPTDSHDAVSILQALRGRVHRVLTGVSVIDTRSGQGSQRTVSTIVRMREYSEEDIHAYVASGEPMDKAGAYAVQGAGGRLVASVEGCYNNVVGLPLCEVVRLLIPFGFPFDGEQAHCMMPNGTPCPRSMNR